DRVGEPLADEPDRANEARGPVDLPPERGEPEGPDDPLADLEGNGELGPEPDADDVLLFGDCFGRKVVGKPVEAEHLATPERLRGPGQQLREVAGGRWWSPTSQLAVGHLEPLPVEGQLGHGAPVHAGGFEEELQPPVDLWIDLIRREGDEGGGELGELLLEEFRLLEGSQRRWHPPAPAPAKKMRPTSYSSCGTSVPRVMRTLDGGPGCLRVARSPRVPRRRPSSRGSRTTRRPAGP